MAEGCRGTLSGFIIHSNSIVIAMIDRLSVIPKAERLFRVEHRQWYEARIGQFETFDTQARMVDN
jgi:RNase P/RNase MRP subunit p29